MPDRLNILLVGYWSIYEGLTQSTILPHLKILSDVDEVGKIIFISIERNGAVKPHELDIDKVQHIPLHSNIFSIRFLNKLSDFRLFPKRLKLIIKHYHIHIGIGVGTQAGTLVMKASIGLKIPFVVSYYDPHAAYMLALGVWKRYDPRYYFLQKWESKLKKHSYSIFPVSNGYKRTLLNEGVNTDKLFTVPCNADLQKFVINRDFRVSLRNQFSWIDDDLVGIYVGKFGDIYLEDEAFHIFRLFKSRNPSFKLIILTGQDKSSLSHRLEKCGYTRSDFFVGMVDHDDVPKYLNASDFAFSLHKPHSISYAYSPIKNGEYWACGLPVLIPDGIGDDSQILKDTGLGVVMEDLEHPEKYFAQLETLIKANKKKEIRQLAVKYRNPETTKTTYQYLIQSLLAKR